MPRLVVVYRTGGTENFKWYPTVTFLSEAEAQSAKEGIEKGGRKAIIFDEQTILEQGLPTTYDGSR
jgi:hypothetical protein